MAGRHKLVVRFAAGLALASILAVVLTLTAMPSQAGRRATGVLLASFPKPLIGFAQDGSRIAWAEAPCGSVVAIRNLLGGHPWTVEDRGAECASLPDQGQFQVLTLGGNRASWMTSLDTDFYNTSIETAVIGGSAKTVGPGEASYSDCGDGGNITDAAADEGIAVYSYVNVHGTSTHVPGSRSAEGSTPSEQVRRSPTFRPHTRSPSATD